MSDLKNIRNIYIYKVLALIVSFMSIFVVVPFLGQDPSAYAIYAFSVSICLFLTYGDFGFLGAAQKYCAEEVGRGQLKPELDYVGFALAILITVGVIFSVSMVFAAYEPTLLLPTIEPNYLQLASRLFLVIAIFMPLQVVLQRFVMLVLASRLREYIAIRFDIAANLLKIILAPLFQTSSGFLLEYFLLTSILLSILSACCAIITTRNLTNFPINLVLSHIRFSSHAYKKMKAIALSSMFSTILFIGYFELDLVIASRFYGLEDVAAYALAFILMNFLRSLSAIIYSPLMAYINRIWGQGKKENVVKNFQLLILLIVPLFMAVSVVLFSGSDILIYQWMARELPLTVSIFQILLVGTFFVGLTNILPLVAMTYESKHILYLVGIIPFIFFYGSFMIMQYVLPSPGVESIAVSKTIGGLAAALFSTGVLFAKSLIDFKSLFQFLWLSLLSFLLTVMLSNYGFLFLLEWERSFFSLLLTVSLFGLLVLIIWIAFLMCFLQIRNFIFNFIKA